MSAISRRKRRLFRLGTAAVLIVAVLAVWFIFQVKEVEVYGNEFHTSGEITSGLVDNFLAKNTLYLAWKYKDGEIPDTLPYLDSLSIKMTSPSHVEVVVTEKALAGYIEKDGYVYFDDEGLILDITDEEYGGIPLITGITTEEAALYQKLPTESSATLRTILSLTRLLEYQELGASEIRFSDNNEITVYIDKIAAQLGQDEYLEEKIANLRKILESLEGQSGTLHLENFTGHNEPVSFTPSDETEPETVPDDTDNTSDGDADGSAGSGGTDDGPGGTDGGSAGDSADSAEDDAADDGSAEEDSYVIIDMVFNSSGTLVYNVHAENGIVVDSSGNSVPGCYVDSDGYIVDAYMNRFDPVTGELSN